MAKYKTTGCFKFLIFLILAVPVAFLASSYYHGEDPLAYVKEKVSQVSTSSETSSSANTAELEDAELEINSLLNKIRELERENENLTRLLDEKQKEISALQLGN